MSTQAPSATTNSSSRPTIFLLSLDTQSFWDETYSNLVDAIADRATIKRATKAQGAITYLTNNTPSAIIITDPALVEGKPALSALGEKVIEYVRGGGTAICATLFSSFVSAPDLNRWFGTSWNLPWQSGDYHRTTVYLSPPSQVRHLDQTTLADKYSQKAVFLKNVARDAAVYLPSRESKIESMVFAPDSVDNAQTPVAFAKIGHGRLGYIGDVNNESGSRAVILAMCGF